MNDDDDDKVNENFSREMEEYNLLLHEKAEAFNKLAKALNDNCERHLTETRYESEGTRINKRKSKSTKS